MAIYQIHSYSGQSPRPATFINLAVDRIALNWRLWVWVMGACWNFYRGSRAGT